MGRGLTKMRNAPNAAQDSPRRELVLLVAFHGRRTVLHYSRFAQPMSTWPAQHPISTFAAAKHVAARKRRMREGLFKAGVRTGRWFPDLESGPAKQADWHGAKPCGGREARRWAAEKERWHE